MKIKKMCVLLLFCYLKQKINVQMLIRKAISTDIEFY